MVNYIHWACALIKLITIKLLLKRKTVSLILLRLLLATRYFILNECIELNESLREREKKIALIATLLKIYRKRTLWDLHPCNTLLCRKKNSNMNEKFWMKIEQQNFFFLKLQKKPIKEIGSHEYFILCKIRTLSL